MPGKGAEEAVQTIMPGLGDLKFQPLTHHTYRANICEIYKLLHVYYKPDPKVIAYIPS